MIETPRRPGAPGSMAVSMIPTGICAGQPAAGQARRASVGSRCRRRAGGSRRVAVGVVQADRRCGLAALQGRDGVGRDDFRRQAKGQHFQADTAQGVPAFQAVAAFGGDEGEAVGGAEATDEGDELGGVDDLGRFGRGGVGDGLAGREDEEGRAGEALQAIRSGHGGGSVAIGVRLGRRGGSRGSKVR